MLEVWIQCSKYILLPLCCVILVTHHTRIYGERGYLNQVTIYDYVMFRWWVFGALRILPLSPLHRASSGAKQARLPGGAAPQEWPVGAASHSQKTKLSAGVSSISEASCLLQLSPYAKFLENLLWNLHFGTLLRQRIDKALSLFLSFSLFLFQRVYFS